METKEKKTEEVKSSSKKGVGAASQSKTQVKQPTASSKPTAFTSKKVEEEKTDVSSTHEENTGTAKAEKKAFNWSCVQGISQILIALGIIAMVFFGFVGCSVDVPEKKPTWAYIPSVTLKEGMEFLFHPETETVDVLKDEEILRSLGEGDTYAFMPYRYLISVVYDEELVLVMNQAEELARFVLE